MFRLAFALAATVAGIPDEMPIPVNVGGRVTADQRFGWPGIYFEGRFRGSDVIVAVETGTEHFRVLIDGKERAVLVKPGTARLSFTGLAAGEHVVRLEKLTESQSGGGRFLGFFTHGESLAPRPRARQIEFIGDSHTVGYGDTSAERECTREQVHDTTDTQQAFGPLVAKALDADYRVIAYSGYGVVRNYAGNVPGENLPLLYPRAIPGEPAAAADDPAWKPQVIVVNLGTNDFSTPVKPGEAWADLAALRTDYRTKYVGFVRMLKARQPQARVFLMGAENFYPDVAQVAAATGATPLQVGALERTGCDWHPSLKDNRATAALVQEVIGKID